MNSRGRAAWLVLVSGLAFVAPVAGAAAEPPRVSVVFVESARFTDVRDAARPSDGGVAAILDELAWFVREEAEAILPPDRRLEVRVTDIDMAGEFEPWRGPQLERVRLMRDVYAPRIDLEFTLTDSAARIVGRGTRRLVDPNYLTRAQRVTNDRLRYEKDLLRDWLRREFAS